MISADVLRKYRKDMIKKVDVYAEEREILSRHKDPKIRAQASKLNEIREEINTQAEAKWSKELDNAIRKGLKDGILKKEVWKPKR